MPDFAKLSILTSYFVKDRSRPNITEKSRKVDFSPHF